MAFLLDTNACIDYFTGRYPGVVARIQGSSPEDLLVSVVAELRYGADHSARGAAGSAGPSSKRRSRRSRRLALGITEGAAIAHEFGHDREFARHRGWLALRPRRPGPSCGAQDGGQLVSAPPADPTPRQGWPARAVSVVARATARSRSDFCCCCSAGTRTCPCSTRHARARAVRRRAGRSA